jgi:hypothetical protein
VREGSKIHHVFHVSQLRRVLAPCMPASSIPPVLPDAIPVPVRILAKRRRHANGTKEQVQVEWSDPTTTDITWEDAAELRQRFPSASLGTSRFSRGRGCQGPNRDGT